MYLLHKCSEVLKVSYLSRAMPGGRQPVSLILKTDLFLSFFEIGGVSSCRLCLTSRKVSRKLGNKVKAINIHFFLLLSDRGRRYCGSKTSAETAIPITLLLAPACALLWLLFSSAIRSECLTLPNREDFFSEQIATGPLHSHLFSQLHCLPVNVCLSQSTPAGLRLSSLFDCQKGRRSKVGNVFIGAILDGNEFLS